MGGVVWTAVAFLSCLHGKSGWVIMLQLSRITILRLPTSRCLTGLPVVAMLLFCVAGSPFSRSAHAALTLDDVRAMLSEQLSSLESVRVQYHLQRSESEEDWIWLQDGQRRLVRRVRQENPNLRAPIYLWYSFDGKNGYDITYDPERPDHMRSISKLGDVPRFYWQQYSPAHWLGLALLSRPDSLAMLLEQDAARVVGEVDLDGSRCVHVDLGAEGQARGASFRWEVWLDPARGGLPRRIRRVPDDSTETGRRLLAEGYETVMDVERFERVRDHATESERWFPMEMTMRGAESRLSMTLNVTSLELNRPIPKGEFVPQPEFGTLVADLTVPPKHPRRYRMEGGEAAVEAMRRAAVERARELTRQAREADGPPVVAEPDDGSRVVSFVRWGAVLMLAAGGALLVWRKARA